MAGGRGGLISLDRHLKLTNVLRQIFGFGAVDFECVLISCHGKWMDDLFIQLHCQVKYSGFCAGTVPCAQSMSI